MAQLGEHFRIELERRPSAGEACVDRNCCATVRACALLARRSSSDRTIRLAAAKRLDKFVDSVLCHDDHSVLVEIKVFGLCLLPLRSRRCPMPLDERFDDLVGVDSGGFGVERGNDAVTQHGQRDAADVVCRYMATLVEQRPGFASHQ